MRPPSAAKRRSQSSSSPRPRIVSSNGPTRSSARRRIAMFADHTSSTSRSAGPRSSAVIGTPSRPHERGSPLSSARIGPPKTATSGAPATPSSSARSQPAGARTSSSMNTTGSPSVAATPALRAAFAPRVAPVVDDEQLGARGRHLRRDRGERHLEVVRAPASRDDDRGGQRIIRGLRRIRRGGWGGRLPGSPPGGGTAQAVGEDLARKREDEAWVVTEVAPPQAARLLDKPVGPFKTGPLQGRRRLWDEPGVKVESRAHPDQDRRV